MGAYVGLDDPYWMEYTFLKDNQPAGGTWTSAQFSGQVTPAPPATPFTATLRWEFTILSQNISQIVNGTHLYKCYKSKTGIKTRDRTEPGRLSLILIVIMQEIRVL